MAQNNQPVVVRSKLLPNNSAAEFVETRTERLFGPDFSRSNGMEFAPELDMFVNQNVASSLRLENHYQTSRDRCKEFQTSLIEFAKMIDDRQLEKRFRVKAKNLQEYSIQDVLKIAEQVQNKHGSNSKAEEHTAVFRRCFASVGRNQGAVNNLLNFIPDDSYGSVIFGGFSMILTAIERAETFRETAYAALAEIPRKLEFINNLTDCAQRSVGLYQAGDAVLVALFGVLTRIIDHLTRRKSKKVMSLLMKGKSYGSDLDAALASLDTTLVAFRDEVSVCNTRKLGDVKESQIRMENSQIRMENVFLTHLQQVTAEKASIAASQPTPSKSIEEGDTNAQIQWILEEKDRIIHVVNQLYRLCASDPKVDRHTGRYSLPDGQKCSKPTKSENEQIVNSWLSTLRLQFQDLAIQDMDNLLKRSSTLSMDDQGKVQYIMANPHLFEWLNAQKSMALLIQSEVAPSDSMNPLSFSSAFLAQTLQGTYKSPVLYYNCRSRGRDSYDEDKSGPLALLDTLNAQLIVHLLNTQGDSINMDFLQHNELSKASQKSNKHKLRQGRRLFERLIGELMESDMVFIIIDGMSWLNGDEVFGDKVLRTILQVASHAERRRIKLLLTDVLSRTVLDQYAYLEVFVHSHIDSRGQSLNLQFLHEETQKSLSPGS